MDRKSIFYFLIFFCISSINGSLNKNSAGPFDVVVQGCEPCPGYEKDEFQFKHKLKKLNRTAIALDVDLWMPSSLGPTDKMIFNLDQMANNKWKENFFKKELSLCVALDVFVPALAAQLYNVFGVDHCFIKPGNYSTKDFVLSLNIKTIPAFFYNKYRGVIEIFSKSGTRKVCVIGYAEVVPKRRKSG